MPVRKAIPTTEIDVDATPAVVAVKTLYEATKLIQRGALASQLINSTFRAADRRFDTYMAGAAAVKGNGLWHMYDWNMIGTNQGKLWKSRLTGRGANRQVTFDYQISHVNVPLDPVLDALEGNGVTFRRHKFRMKAPMFESGKAYTIERDQSDWLVWAFKGQFTEREDRRKGEKSGAPNFTLSKDQKVAFSQDSSYIGKGFGGGRTTGKFNAAFIFWWTSEAGAGADAKEMSKRLQRSSAVRMTRAAAEKRNVSSAKKTLSDATTTALAKKRAQKVIDLIEGDLN